MQTLTDFIFLGSKITAECNCNHEIKRHLLLILSQRSLRLSSFLFILFSLFCSAAVVSTTLYFSSFIHSSASVFLLVILSSAFINFSYCLISVCLFFNSYRSLLTITCVILICASILFLRSCIIFTIITLNTFSGRFAYLYQLLFWDFILYIHLGYIPLSSHSNFLYCGFHTLDYSIVILASDT